jgi:hypothetical protein
MYSLHLQGRNIREPPAHAGSSLANKPAINEFSLEEHLTRNPFTFLINRKVRAFVNALMNLQIFLE